MATEIRITVSDDVYRQILDAARNTGKDLSEYIVNSFGVMNKLQAEKKDGKQILVGRNNKAEKELTIP